MVILAIMRLYLSLQQWHVKLDLQISITHAPPKG